MTLTNPLVTIIIPVRNGEHTIGRTIASAVGQTYNPLEIIVVDDGSVDQTAEVVNVAARQDPRISLFRRPPSGLPATRNFAISQAKGELIAPLDGDDLWHPQKLTKQVLAIQKSDRIGLVYCWTVDIDELDFIVPPVREKKVAEGRVLENVIAGAGLIESGSVPLIRRKYLQAIGGYDDKMIRGAEDWKMSLALAEICEFAVIREHLVGYRQSTTSMSKNVGAMREAFETVMQWVTEQWPDTPKIAIRSMGYHVNAYLAHQEFANNHIAKALGYQLRAYKAYPPSLFSTGARHTALRFLVRVLGLRRKNFSAGTKATFAEFCARDQKPVTIFE